MSERGWATVDDIGATLRRSWERGELLRWSASGLAWVPLRVPLRGPTARDLSEHFGAVQAWAASLREAAGAGASRARFRLETRRVGGRLVGANEVPAAAWFDTPEQVWSLLRLGREVAAYRTVLDQARDADPALGAWVAAHPLRALAQAADWERVLRTVLWLCDKAGSGAYLRQIDVPGVDTKFIETRQGLLVELLDGLALADHGGSTAPAERPVAAVAGPRDLARRYGFATKPDRIRLRSLDGSPVLPATPVTDVAVRVDELAVMAVACEAVLVVENEITFLALPSLPEVVAFFGAGFDVLRLGRLPWLADRRVLYWGDLDTHGFVILDRLRGVHPHVESVLMDEATLLGHRDQWVREHRPSREVLTRLSPSEASLYADLVGDVHGRSVRLEQERVNYARVLTTLADAVGSGAGRAR